MTAHASGSGRMKTTIIVGLAFMTTWYFTLLASLSGRPDVFGLTPGDDFCPPGNAETCSRPDLFCFQMTSILPILICGFYGFYVWHIRRRPQKGIAQTAAGRLYGYLPESEYIAAVCFTFQVWDFFISMTIPEHRTVIMITHHFLAATVSGLSVHFQILHYYGVFFLGLSEFSSIFLVFVDLSNYYPPPAGGLYDTLIGAVAGPMFCVAFIVYRVVLWWPTSIQLFRDVYEVVHTGKAEELRPGQAWILYIFLAVNIPLGLLQLYWLTIILEEASKVLLS